MNNQGIWFTQVFRQDGAIIDVPLRFGPKDVEDVPMTGSLDSGFNKAVVYITFDPYVLADDSLGKNLQYFALASAELTVNLAQGMNRQPEAACIESGSRACEDRPIKSCDSDDAVIYIKYSEEPSVILDGNCATIQGSDWGIVKATDRLLLKLYNIME